MKKNVKRLVIIAAIVFVLWNLGSLLFGRTASEMVQYGALEDAFDTTLYLFKDELVIEGAEGGVLQPTAVDGKRIHKGARIGALLSANTDEAALHEYLRIQDRVDRLQKLRQDTGYTETVRTDEQITSLSLSITAAASRGNMEEVTELKNELMIAKDEKSAASGQKEALLKLLRERQNALTSSFGSSIKEIFSPEAGILFLQTDGMEESMTVKAASGLTPSTLEDITADMGVSKGGCKILYSNEWKAACTVSAELASTLKVGQAVSLRLRECGGKTEKASIAEISAEEDGKCVVVFSSNRTPEGLMQLRKVTADVILSRYEGLRVPNEAIVTENDVTGVYVQTVTDKVFRKAEVSYQGEKYAIIREGENTTLRLYDTVIY